MERTKGERRAGWPGVPTISAKSPCPRLVTGPCGGGGAADGLVCWGVV